VIEERQNNTVDTIKNVINDPEIAWLITKVVVMIFLGTFMFVAYRGIRSKIESMSKTSSPPS
jgi:fructose-specific phosphotransferase system IIC component